METIEIKRKFFDVIEKVGDHSYKVERNGKFYFMRKFENNKKGFEEFLSNYKRLKYDSIEMPEIYALDKKVYIAVTDWIEGPTALEYLLENDPDEDLLQKVFLLEWFSRRDRILLDFRPHNFRLSGNKLIYLPYTFINYHQEKSFVQSTIRLWFHTKEFAKYVESQGLTFDSTRLGNEYQLNKQMALMSVKYYH